MNSRYIGDAACMVLMFSKLVEHPSRSLFSAGLEISSVEISLLIFLQVEVAMVVGTGLVVLHF